MNRALAIDRLASELRAIASRNPLKAGEEIERLLSERLGLLEAPERLRLVEELAARFASAPPDDGGRPEALAEVVGLLLGSRIRPGELPPAEILQRLADSLNTVFDSLNRLVQVIQSSLLGDGNPQKTIHQVIGDHLRGEDRLQALENYIGQISRAFLLTQQAFKAAAEKTAQKLLRELDPQAIDAEDGKGLRFGPLKKADRYDAYEQKYQLCRRWLDSGKFGDHLLREVERTCRQKMTAEMHRPKGGPR
jgi:hypothetical protein